MGRAKHGWTDFHVYNRGCRRLVLFKDEEDCAVFLRILKGAAAVTGCVIWAYVIMNNHFHLAVHASSGRLSQMMFRVDGLYSRHHNGKYGFSGHAFEGPYEAHAVGTIQMLVRIIAYICLNPVSAGMVREPEDYPWSAYRSWVGLRGAPLDVNPIPVLTRLSSDPAKARSEFVRIFNRERRRLEVLRKPAHTVRDIQAGLFEWLVEEARAKAGAEDIDPLVLAIHWADEAGIMRGAVRKVVGGPVSGALRMKLVSFRKWLSESPADRIRLSAPA